MSRKREHAPQPTTIEHECRQRRRCKSRIKGDDDQFRGAGVERAGTLCRACETTAFEALRKLATDTSELKALLLATATGQQGPKVTSSSGRPVPIRLDVDAMITTIETEVIRWARVVNRGLDGDTSIQRCVDILSAATGTLVDLPTRRFWTLEPHPDGGDYLQLVELDGVDAVLRLARLHHHARDIIGTELRFWLAEPCHVCGMRALAATDDQELVKCHACLQVWSKEEFARLNDVLDDAPPVMTPRPRREQHLARHYRFNRHYAPDAAGRRS